MRTKTGSPDALSLLHEIIEKDLDRLSALEHARTAEELLRLGYVRGAFSTPPGADLPTDFVIEDVTDAGRAAAQRRRRARQPS